MIKYLHILLITLAGITTTILHAETLSLKSNHDYAISDLALNNGDLLWLTKKNHITIGIYGPLTPPLAIKDSEGKLKGIEAEYFSLIENTLKVKVKIKFFITKQDADLALKAEDIDLLVTHSEQGSVLDSYFLHSIPLVFSYPALIAKKENIMFPLHSSDRVKVAIMGHYPSEYFIKTRYKNAAITSFNNVEEALFSVENGKSDVFFGTNLEAGYYLSSDFHNTLNLVKTWDHEELLVSFSLNKSNVRLLNIINLFIDSISTKTHNKISSPWLDIGNISLYDGPLDLSKKEQSWINKNKTIRVIINPYNFPFSMTDSNKDIRGITGDMLDLIHIKTGINFQPIFVKSNSEVKKITTSGEWDLHPTATYSSERAEKALFTQPYLSSPFVFITKNKAIELIKKTNKAVVAIPTDHILKTFIEKNYPFWKILDVENSSKAINMLNEGEVDIAISTKLTAQYYLKHFSSDNLQFHAIPHAPDAEIAFAVPHHLHELQSIINKVIDDIPPKQIAILSNKWLSMPNIQVNTWDIYKKEFYLVIILSLLLIGSTLFWGGHLLSEMKKRKSIEKNLKDQLNFSSKLSTSVPYPLYVITSNGELKSCNPAFTSFFSDSEKTGPGIFISMPSHPLYHIFNIISATIESNLAKDNVFKYTTKINNGTEARHVIIWFTLLEKDIDNNPLLICGWTDITEQKMLLDALKIESNNATIAKQAKGEFLAQMSHELRTPVSAIMGFLELIRLDKPDNATTENNIELAYTTGKTLLSLIGDVLDLEKIASGSFELNEEWINIKPFLLSIIEMFNALAFQKGLEIKLDCHIDPKHHLFIDPKAIHQVLSNLVSNAIKFTDQGSINITAELSSDSAEKDLLVISVIDSGVGISELEQEKLFKMFSQTSSGKLKTGSGLGLYICNEIISLMKGRIFLSTATDHGSTFTMEVPVLLSDTASVPTLDADTLPLQSVVSELNILVADDNPTNRLLISRQFLHLGYTIDEVINGQEAFDAVNRKAYDLLITDINMPVLDGVELVTKIREYDNDLIIWGLTANARSEEKERCLASGMQLLLFKPINIDELSDLLSSVEPRNIFSSLENIIDMETLSSLSMEQPKLMRQMLEHARDECQKDMEGLHQALATNNWHAVEHHAHRIAGTAQILGGSSIVHLCETIELHLDANVDDNVIYTVIDSLDKELSQFITAVNHFMASSATSS